MIELADGLVLFERRLPLEEQRALWRTCVELSQGPVPMYTPTVRGGKKMSVGMLCLGRHWNGMTYAYEDARSDFDGLRVPPIPEEMSAIARSAAADAGFAMTPDLCIMNFYAETANHRWKPSHQRWPVVSAPTGVSIFVADSGRGPTEAQKAYYNLIYAREHFTGGHFAAAEEPELVVEDIRATFRGLR